jgi:precorrin-6B methylase 2
MLSRLLVKPENMFWERRLGIQTRASEAKDPGTNTEHEYYGTVSYRALFRMLEAAEMKPSDVFVDIGCGKGRALCCAALSGIAEVVGIEDVAELCQKAKQNLEQLRGRQAKVNIVQGKAQEFDYTKGSVFYLFNPFGPLTLKEVLAKIGEAVAVHRKPIKIIYANPAYESVFSETPWLERYKQMDRVTALAPELKASFWRSKEASVARP